MPFHCFSRLPISSRAFSSSLAPPQVSGDAYALQAYEWMRKAGVGIVGGCCGIFPEHIAAVAKHLKPRGRVVEPTDDKCSKCSEAKRQKR